jgi:hypothetical protein
MRPENGMKNRGAFSGELRKPEVTPRKGALPKVHFIVYPPYTSPICSMNFYGSSGK